MAGTKYYWNTRKNNFSKLEFLLTPINLSPGYIRVYTNIISDNSRIHFGKPNTTVSDFKIDYLLGISSVKSIKHKPDENI
jgi:hypothetical protein